jgi:cytoskeletal protein CcmA (bactofilin family)
MRYGEVVMFSGHAGIATFQGADSMWKSKGEREEPASYSTVKPSKEASPLSVNPQESKTESWNDPGKSVAAHIGKSVVIRGELSGSENLYIDGQVEGTIELRDHNLIVGPNGRVHAHVNAKEVIIQGTVLGDIRAVDRVDIRKSGALTGDLVAARVVMEDGAFFKGSVDIQKGMEGGKPGEVRKPAAVSASSAATSKPAASPYVGTSK